MGKCSCGSVSVTAVLQMVLWFSQRRNRASRGGGGRHFVERTHVIVKLLMSVTYKELLEAGKRIAVAQSLMCPSGVLMVAHGLAYAAANCGSRGATGGL